MSEIVREIEAEMKQEKIQKLWRSFGSYLVMASLMIVAATAIAVWWKNHKQSQNSHATALLYQGNQLLSQAKFDEAGTKFAAITEGGMQLKSMGDLQEAKVKLAAGKTDAALVLLKGIANDRLTDPAIRAQARLLALSYAKEHDAAWMTELEASAKSGEPFAATASEMLALAHIEKGNTKGALAALDSIRKDENAPPSLKERANRLYLSIASM